MKNSFLGIILLLILVNPFFIYSQIDSIFNMSIIEVNAPKIRNKSVGTNSLEWNTSDLSTITSNNISELLNRNSNVYIKSYGFGSLATSSIRGGNAGQTLVLWNGLPIQSPMLGLVDLALLPTGSIDKIHLQSGGSSALWGSGAIGGVISLSSQAKFDEPLRLESKTLLGSFGLMEQQLKLEASNKKIHSTTRLFFRQSDNDFYYQVAKGFPKIQQTNAKLVQRNLLQDFHWLVNSSNKLSIYFWEQNSMREIPPTSVQTRSLAEQNDTAIRLVLNWEKNNHQSIIKTKVGFFDEHIDYFDKADNSVHLNHFRNFIGDFTVQKYINGQNQFLAGSSYSHTKAWSKNYLKTPLEQKTSLFFSWKWSKKSLQTQASIRQTLVDHKLTPLLPEIGLNYQALSFLKLKLKISRNYRLPTLNERYWQPGGNTNLLPESGWSQEGTIQTNLKRGKLHFHFSLTGFNRKISNWILWSRNEDEYFVSAKNIAKVWSRGLASKFTINYLSNKLKFKWTSGYDYIRSTSLVALDFPNIPIGRQLIYTPKHQIFSDFSFEYGSLHFTYNHIFKGAVLGINEDVSPFQVGEINVKYGLGNKTSNSQIFFTINNVWNTNYRVIERRPMPGINYQFGINFLIKSKNREI